MARLLHYDNRETPLAGNFVGRCQGHKSDVSTQSWVLISEKDNVTISGRCLYTHVYKHLPLIVTLSFSLMRTQDWVETSDL